MADGTHIEWTSATGKYDETAYQRSRSRWTSMIWQGRQGDLFPGYEAILKGDKFERIVQRSIFARLAITDVTRLSELAAHAPFDFIGHLADERVAIEVSSKWQKRVGDKERLATALGLPFYLLLVSPRDPGFYFFTPVRAGTLSIRIPIDLLRTMATAFGEEWHGR